MEFLLHPAELIYLISQTMREALCLRIFTVIAATPLRTESYCSDANRNCDR